jgi:hypothetical protein
MTVRTWITLSVLVVLALGAAFAVRFLSPIRPPDLLVRTDDTPLRGVLVEFCWQQRDGELRCEERTDVEPPDGPSVPAEGELRLLAAFPVQPEGGTIRIADEDGDTELRSEWTDELPYDLDPGDYTLEAEARYPDGAFVRYVFAFSIDG